ncbi:hypothetical protein [Acinetobacter sp. ANC 4639]
MFQGLGEGINIIPMDKKLMILVEHAENVDHGKDSYTELLARKVFSLSSISICNSALQRY